VNPMMPGLAPRKARPRVPRLHGEGGKHRLTSFEGLTALSLDAMTSVAYGPEAIVVALVAAGTTAITAALPIMLVIAGLLGVLVVSYRQVIAVHPDGGGAYAVAKKDLGRTASLLAAASLIVDYVLTVAVSLAAGAASLASAFPVLGRHLLVVCVIGLVLLTAVNMFGVADSARVLALPMLLFVACVFGIVIVGLLRPHPVAVVGTGRSFQPTEALGILLLLKAFASGCTALTGVEAIANAVPMFRTPRVRRAQHTELMLGVLLGLMLIGLAALIRRDHVAPREGVTLLAQLTAGAYGTGWAYYATNLIVTLALGLAANTSFGGLPVLMSLLARDDRLPHVFQLRGERPVHRYGVMALAILALGLLIAVNGDTQALIPLFAIGVFIGFTLSQTGLVRHWRVQRPRGWQRHALVNGIGAVLTVVAGVVLLATKFVAGAWIVVVAIPLLMLLFARIEHYYAAAEARIMVGGTPPPPTQRASVVFVPLGRVSTVAEHALGVARSLGDEVVALAVHRDEDEAEAMRAAWRRWNPGVPLHIIGGDRPGLIGPIVDYVGNATNDDRQVAVVIPQIEPSRRRYRVLQTQRGVLLAAVLTAETNAAVCLLPYRLSI
jgi:amino acid transporter